MPRLKLGNWKRLALLGAFGLVVYLVTAWTLASGNQLWLLSAIPTFAVVASLADDRKRPKA